MPGEYVLQVVVTDKLAKEKHRTASQWIDFEVIPGAAPSEDKPADPRQPLPD